MPTIRIPNPIRSYVNGQQVIPVKGIDVAAALEYFLFQFPALRPHFTNSKGELRPFVNLFLGENNIRDLQGLETRLIESDQLVILFSIAGG